MSRISSPRPSRNAKWLRAALAVSIAVSVAVPGMMVSASAATTWAAPVANSTFDYQIGGAYTLPSGVTTVSRDRNDTPAAGAYNICYVNGFQTQTDELSSVWKPNKSLLLAQPGVTVPSTADPTKSADVDKYWVSDSGWDEILLDVSTSTKRTALLAIVGAWIDGCKADGFKAVEIDNLDSWTRNSDSASLLDEADAAAFATLLAARAHANGLAIAQKNTTDILDKKAAIGFDFAIAEECARYNECGDYTAVYGNKVIVIEYKYKYFAAACASSSIGGALSVVRRDLDVTTPSSTSYRYASC